MFQPKGVYVQTILHIEVREHHGFIQHSYFA